MRFRFDPFLGRLSSAPGLKNPNRHCVDMGATWPYDHEWYLGLDSGGAPPMSARPSMRATEGPSGKVCMAAPQSCWHTLHTFRGALILPHAPVVGLCYSVRVCACVRACVPLGSCDGLLVRTRSRRKKCVCVCVCACMRVRVRVCVRGCVSGGRGGGWEG